MFESERFRKIYSMMVEQFLSGELDHIDWEVVPPEDTEDRYLKLVALACAFMDYEDAQIQRAVQYVVKKGDVNEE